MDSQDLQVLAALRRWAAGGHRAARSSPWPAPGARRRARRGLDGLRDDGQVQGSVSGGCIEDDLVARMLDSRIAGSQPFVLTYGVTRDEAARFGLPCGGTWSWWWSRRWRWPARRSGPPHRGRPAGAARRGHRHRRGVTCCRCLPGRAARLGRAAPVGGSTARAGGCSSSVPGRSGATRRWPGRWITR